MILDQLNLKPIHVPGCGLSLSFLWSSEWMSVFTSENVSGLQDRSTTVTLRSTVTVMAHAHINCIQSLFPALFLMMSFLILHYTVLYI